MSNTSPQLIAIKKVTTDKNGKVVVRDEVIRPGDVKSFRDWFKTEKEKVVDGPITLVVLEDEINDKKTGKPKQRTLLINESFKDFSDRMSKHIVIR